jgi:hypothetical protein
MLDSSATWKELKAKFLRDFTANEQLFFLKKARECVNQKGYPVSEDLFNYCYFLTLRERLSLIDPQGGEGMMRFMLVESRREIEAEVKMLEKRLEGKKLPATDERGRRMLEYFSK